MHIFTQFEGRRYVEKVIPNQTAHIFQQQNTVFQQTIHTHLFKVIWGFGTLMHSLVIPS